MVLYLWPISTVPLAPLVLCCLGVPGSPFFSLRKSPSSAGILLRLVPFIITFSLFSCHTISRAFRVAYAFVSNMDGGNFEGSVQKAPIYPLSGHTSTTSLRGTSLSAFQHVSRFGLTRITRLCLVVVDLIAVSLYVAGMHSVCIGDLSSVLLAGSPSYVAFWTKVTWLIVNRFVCDL